MHRKWCHIADKIAGDPTLLEIPLENIALWSHSRRDGLAFLEKWRGLIEAAKANPAGMTALLDLLRDDSEAARWLKSYSPFPGVLSSAEVDLYRCSWRH